MKKLISLFALLLALSFAAFAEDQHCKIALEHANAAVQQGKANNAKELVKHANAAMEHTLAAALVLTGQPKEHLEAASNELEEAVNHGNLGHTDVATQHAEAAVTHIQAGNTK